MISYQFYFLVISLATVAATATASTSTFTQPPFTHVDTNNICFVNQSEQQHTPSVVNSCSQEDDISALTTEVTLLEDKIAVLEGTIKEIAEKSAVRGQIDMWERSSVSYNNGRGSVLNEVVNTAAAFIVADTIGSIFEVVLSDKDPY